MFPFMTGIKAFYVSERKEGEIPSGEARQFPRWNSISCANSKVGMHGANGKHIIKSFTIMVQCFYGYWKMKVP